MKFCHNKFMTNTKVAVVTGASSGIGLAVANLLGQNGYKVYGLSRREVKNQNFESLVCDITDQEMAKSTLNMILKKEGKIDVLINNAGRGMSGAFESIGLQNRRAEFELNYFALTNMCEYVLPSMRQNGGGRIVNISSLAGVFPIPYQSGYSASKFAVNGFSMALRNEVKNFGVWVSAVMPGDTKTGFTDARIKTHNQNYTNLDKSVKKMEKDERKGMPSEKIAKTVLKLLKSKRPKALVSVGFKNKFLVFLSKILPNNIMLFVVNKMYN